MDDCGRSVAAVPHGEPVRVGDLDDAIPHAALAGREGVLGL